MTQRFDVAIVGGGPAGSAAAWQAAQAGARVLLLDKAEFPRDKPCGDGLTARAVSYLQKMGLADEVTYLAKNDYFQLWSPEAFRRNEARKAEALRDKVGPGRTAKVLLDMAPPGLSPEPGNGPAGA